MGTEKLLADDRTKDRIAEEFQPFVGEQTMIGSGRMRQGGVQKLLVDEYVVQA